MPTDKLLQFGELSLDAEAHEVIRNGKRHYLREDYWNAVMLLASSSRGVRKDELYRVLGCSTDGALTKHVQRIREILGDTKKPFRIIQSEASKGYRWFAGPSNAVLATTPVAATAQAAVSFGESIHPVLTRWDPGKGGSGGIWAGTQVIGGHFIPASELKTEVETKLLPNVGNIPTGTTIAVADFGENRNGVVHLVGPDQAHLGDIWFGSNPYENWVFDGLVRVGEARADRPLKVWQIFQRYSDGSYIEIKTAAETA